MVSAVALDVRGLKRICTGCGTRFYDMNKRPVKCPSCAVEFSSENKIKTRRGRAPLPKDQVIDKKAVQEEENELPADELETVSLDEVAALESVDDEEEGFDDLAAGFDAEDDDDFVDIEKDLDDVPGE